MFGAITTSMTSSTKSSHTIRGQRDLVTNEQPTGSGIDGSALHEYPADQIVVTWDKARCLHFAECVRGLPQVFEPGRRPWIEPRDADALTVAEVIRRCPSGALQYTSNLEPTEVGDVPTTIEPTAWGPLIVRGEIAAVEKIGSATEREKETRVSLCACGRTSFGPYCDDSCREAATDNADLRS
jgi:uncharacterized Fe-S cluster protein YjdI/CDGSH-type Zn-finger protein